MYDDHRELGTVGKIIAGVVLIPVFGGALALPVLAVWGFYTGDLLTGTICAVLTIALLFGVVPWAVSALRSRRS